MGPFNTATFLIAFVASCSAWHLRVTLNEIFKGNCRTVSPRVCRKSLGADPDYSCGFILRSVCAGSNKIERVRVRRSASRPSHEHSLHVTPLPKKMLFYDANQDGKISLKEFARTLGHDPRLFHVKNAFKAADRNDDGIIDIREFKNDVWIFDDDLFDDDDYDLEEPDFDSMQSINFDLLDRSDESSSSESKSDDSKSKDSSDDTSDEKSDSDDSKSDGDGKSSDESKDSDGNDSKDSKDSSSDDSKDSTKSDDDSKDSKDSDKDDSDDDDRSKDSSDSKDSDKSNDEDSKDSKDDDDSKNDYDDDDDDGDPHDDDSIGDDENDDDADDKDDDSNDTDSKDDDDKKSDTNDAVILPKEIDLDDGVVGEVMENVVDDGIELDDVLPDSDTVRDVGVAMALTKLQSDSNQNSHNAIHPSGPNIDHSSHDHKHEGFDFSKGHSNFVRPNILNVMKAPVGENGDMAAANRIHTGTLKGGNGEWVVMHPRQISSRDFNTVTDRLNSMVPPF